MNSLQELKVEVDKLKLLLDDMHPGLSTWQGFLKERMDNILDIWKEPPYELEGDYYIEYVNGDVVKLRRVK